MSPSVGCFAQAQRTFPTTANILAALDRPKPPSLYHKADLPRPCALRAIDSYETMYALCATILCLVGVAWLLYGRGNRRSLLAFTGAWSQDQCSSSKSCVKQHPKDDFSTQFPPSQRDSLVSSPLAPTNATTDQRMSLQLLPMGADYRLADPSLYIFSGFSVSEIKSMGNFPDYAKLSGVPLPTALKEFSVDTAMPRPYRPFRWPYFQTMGKYHDLTCWF